MAANTLEDLIRGDMPLARFIFGDEKKRRLIRQLQQDGWPIIDVAGKRSGFPDQLTAVIVRTRKAAQRQEKRQAQSPRSA